ncbi:hypothetical protein [Massilia sp.]|uniref:hypothetical protein n=1 Tax=Massilia sp. TaxID=1882437 RepID=UPI0028A02697|nr:hypothetical protein [Massilia sp.]
MPSWLSRILIGLAVFGACWSGVLWYWNSAHHMPGTADIVLWLLLLPLALLLALWALRKLATGAAARSAAAAAAAAAAASQAAAAPAPAALPPATLTVLAGALRTPHGDHPAVLAEAMLSRQANLQLDPELLDERGYPILSGRAGDVDIPAQQDAMADWLQQHHPDARLQDEQWRALALGSAVALELASELAAHPALPAYLDALAARKSAPPLPTLHLLAALPAEWAAPERAAGAAWLRAVVAQYGWPLEQISIDVPAPGQVPLAALDTLAGRAVQAKEPFLCLLLACDSRIGEASVQDWAERAILLDSRHPQGRVPGEGAAGLLLADRSQAALLDTLDAPLAPLLYPAAGGVRAGSADARGQIDATLLEHAAAELLDKAGIGADTVTLVTADSDARASRVGETMGMASTLLPELDPASQVLSVAAACGDAGDASLVAALVLAQQHVRDGAGAALCVSNLDPFQRSVVLLAPQPQPDAASAPADTAQAITA